MRKTVGSASVYLNFKNILSEWVMSSSDSIKKQMVYMFPILKTVKIANVFRSNKFW